MGRKGGQKGNGKKKSQRGGGMRRIRGRGDYQVATGGGGGGGRTGIFAKLDRALARIPRGTFGRAGASVGAKYGGNLGAKVGAMAGAGLSAISGYGDYKVKMNSLSRMSTSVDMIPQFVKNDHSVRIVHREFVRDVVVPANAASFDIKAYLINPANKDLFPWLANMAKQYSQYKIHGMVFAFKTMSSDYSQAGPLGTVMMATNYNAVDRDFTSKLELENTEFAVSTKPSMSLVHALECDPKYSGMDVLYIRDPSYETTDTSDKRFYDYGKFQIATQGLPGTPTTTMGELWISYDIELMKPIIGGSYALGKAVISKADGTVGVSDSAGSQLVTFQGSAVTPVAASIDRLLFSTYIATGKTGLVGTVVDVNLNSIILKKNGNYSLTLWGVGPTTSTAYIWAKSDVQATIDLPITSAGVAQAAILTPAGTIIGYPPTLNYAGTQLTTANGFQYRLGWEIVVTGILSANDYITLTPSTFTTATLPASVITSVSKRVTVNWTALATNDQAPAYTAVYA